MNNIKGQSKKQKWGRPIWEGTSLLSRVIRAKKIYLLLQETGYTLLFLILFNMKIGKEIFWRSEEQSKANEKKKSKAELGKLSWHSLSIRKAKGKRRKRKRKQARKKKKRNWKVLMGKRKKIRRKKIKRERKFEN